MIRVVLINLLLLLLPFIIYFGYVYLVKGNSNDPPKTAPLLALFAIGLVMMMGAIVYFIQFEGGQPGQAYSPPVIRDGAIQPGRLE
jgi:hypothetical protein